MSCHTRVDEWTTIIRTQLPLLSKPQATVLALWSLGMVLARSCALSAVSVWLATWLQRKEQTVRQQLREWCDEAEAKQGTHRQALAVEPCFVPLLRWVLSRWQGTQLALALDATLLGTRFAVLAVSVVYRGCAMPVAWTILRANTQHAWRRHWLRMLRQVRPAIPPHWTVIVLADRGLYAGWLFRRIVRLGWHPFLRINAGGTFRPDPQATSRPLTSFVPQLGTRWHGTGAAFKSRPRRLRCTLLARWDEGHTAPWLILTDLPPEASEASWYGLRAWIEPQFTCLKRAGWQWQRTRMTQPDRAARLWLAVAVATRWLLSVGGVAEDTIPASTLLDVTDVLAHQRRQRRATRLRLVSIFRRGWIMILVAWLEQQPLPLGGFVPEPWPTMSRLDHQALAPELSVSHVAA
jgi:Transposase DDE domain